jgi:putative transcriptional regulator
MDTFGTLRNMKLKNSLREWRTNKSHLTQAQFAELLGVSRQTVISLENGKYNPSLELALKISTALNCHIEDIFELAENSEKKKFCNFVNIFLKKCKINN